MEYYLNKTLDPSFTGAVFSYLSTTSYTNSINKQNFTLTILNEAVVTSQIVFYFTKNFYLLDEFDQKISQFKANGLIYFWISKHFNSDKMNSNRFKSRQQSLNLQELQGIFVLHFYGLLIAFLVFCLEKIQKQFKRFLKVIKIRHSFMKFQRTSEY